MSGRKQKFLIYGKNRRLRKEMKQRMLEDLCKIVFHKQTNSAQLLATTEFVAPQKEPWQITVYGDTKRTDGNPIQNSNGRKFYLKISAGLTGPTTQDYTANFQHSFSIQPRPDLTSHLHHVSCLESFHTAGNLRKPAGMFCNSKKELSNKKM